MKSYQVEYWDFGNSEWFVIECDSLSEAQDEFNRLDSEGYTQLEIVKK
jgi:hypothetical protein